MSQWKKLGVAALFVIFLLLVGMSIFLPGPDDVPATASTPDGLTVLEQLEGVDDGKGFCEAVDRDKDQFAAVYRCCTPVNSQQMGLNETVHQCHEYGYELHDGEKTYTVLDG
jgi:hypothetical protein